MKIKSVDYNQFLISKTYLSVVAKGKAQMGGAFLNTGDLKVLRFKKMNEETFMDHFFANAYRNFYMFS